ncbi:DUF3853 family protein [Empedobacter brevis]
MAEKLLLIRKKHWNCLIIILNKMINIDRNKLISELTVGEFLDLTNNLPTKKEYVYGLKGLAKILGCSRTKASVIKQSGILDDAISQNGKIIVIDKDKALKLFGNK